MKKLLLFALLIISLSLQAQNKGYITGLKKLTLQETSEIASEIASYSNMKLRLYEVKETPAIQTLSYKYVPAELTDEQVSHYKYSAEQAKSFIIVDFSFYMDGENKDLGNIGAKQYRLNEVKAKYKVVFTYWKKYFRPDAELVTTINSYKHQRFKDYESKIDSYIRKNGDIWELHNN
ncbi:hypothetical protein GCM10007424_23620 [Flavobacterium suaedae]|uniref:DUF4468 domain-containing protein n=1 Tax=Flavobacterium suaedae TaxID=1767027 RepID=A0ABQ1JZA4_9FLAO|nr:hypothetical protein [Flavobacterium suaedae]GGB82870.1 hypothetical protein GCM10007424_23620 [Flavobacterium suaedae]